MMNILYLFTILIIISSSLYPAFALDTSQKCDRITPPVHWPSSHIYVTDTNQSLPYVPLTYHTAIFHDDDVWNTSTYPRTVHVTLTIREKYTGQQVFNQTQSLQMQSCSGPESVKWRFVPIQADNYIATVSDDRGDVGMGFNSMLGTTQEQTVSLPLEQFRFGVNSHNVICRQDLQLVIKSEDDTPACVSDISMGKMTRQGWWAWNNKVGNTIINNTGKKEFESKDCAISETMSAIVGTNGFVMDDLPVNGTIFYGADTSRMVAGVIQFAIHPGNTAQITLTYDFNPYPGSNCKVTTNDVISAENPGKPGIMISDLIGSPDIMKVDENSINTSIPPLGNSGDVLLNLASMENLNDHVVKVTYKIFTKSPAQLGKSYFIGFWWHSAVVITIGDSLYTGHAFEGTHYG